MHPLHPSVEGVLLFWVGPIGHGLISRGAGISLITRPSVSDAVIVGDRVPDRPRALTEDFSLYIVLVSFRCCPRTLPGGLTRSQGLSLAESLGIWTRWRPPTGLRSLDRPVRYVLEYAFTRYFGPDGDMLGFNNLNSLGAGLELDTSALEGIATQWRLIGRFRFGENVRGWGVGLGISF
jgi:hypothetical protein